MADYVPAAAEVPEEKVPEDEPVCPPVEEEVKPESAEPLRKKRKRNMPEAYRSVIDGKPVILYKGTSVVEDPRWIHILQVKENGTKRYRCPGCGHEFTGKEGRVIIHKLRKGGEVKPCTQLPSPECRAVLERVDGVKSNARAAIYRASGRGDRMDYRRYPDPYWAIRGPIYNGKMMEQQNVITLQDGSVHSMHGVPGLLPNTVLAHDGTLQWGGPSAHYHPGMGQIPGTHMQLVNGALTPVVNGATIAQPLGQSWDMPGYNGPGAAIEHSMGPSFHSALPPPVPHAPVPALPPALSSQMVQSGMTNNMLMPSMVPTAYLPRMGPLHVVGNNGGI